MTTSERLNAYLQASDDELPSFARRLGVSPETLTRAAEGEQGALTLEEARRVSAATNGAVRTEELLGHAAGAGEVFDLREIVRATSGWPKDERDALALRKALRVSLGEATGIQGGELDALAALATEAVAHTALALTPDDPNAPNSALDEALQLVAKEILLEIGVPADALDARAMEVRRRARDLLGSPER